MYVQDVATVKDTAAQAVSEFIRSPDLFQFDLFESPTITQLKDDSKYGHLYQLLEIILNGNLQVSPLGIQYHFEGVLYHTHVVLDVLLYFALVLVPFCHAVLGSPSDPHLSFLLLALEQALPYQLTLSDSFLATY